MSILKSKTIKPKDYPRPTRTIKIEESKISCGIVEIYQLNKLIDKLYYCYKNQKKAIKHNRKEYVTNMLRVIIREKIEEYSGSSSIWFEGETKKIILSTNMDNEDDDGQEASITFPILQNVFKPFAEIEHTFTNASSGNDVVFWMCDIKEIIKKMKPEW